MCTCGLDTDNDLHRSDATQSDVQPWKAYSSETESANPRKRQSNIILPGPLYTGARMIFPEIPSARIRQSEEDFIVRKKLFVDFELVVPSDDCTPEKSSYGEKSTSKNNENASEGMTNGIRLHKQNHSTNDILANINDFLNEMEEFSTKVQEQLDKDDIEPVFLLHSHMPSIAEKDLKKHIVYYSKWFRLQGIYGHCVFITECVFSFSPVSHGASTKIHLLIAASSQLGIAFKRIQFGEFCKKDYEMSLEKICSNSENKNCSQSFFIFENWPRSLIKYSELKDKRNIDVKFLPPYQDHFSMLTPLKEFIFNRVKLLSLQNDVTINSFKGFSLGSIDQATLQNLVVCRYLDETLNLITTPMATDWFKTLASRFSLKEL